MKAESMVNEIIVGLSSGITVSAAMGIIVRSLNQRISKVEFELDKKQTRENCLLTHKSVDRDFARGEKQFAELVEAVRELTRHLAEYAQKLDMYIEYSKEK